LGTLRGALALTLLTLTMATGALAQTYPYKPLKAVVPYPAGGGTDVIARIITERLAATLGQPVIIENRGGAATLIGSEYVAKSAGDGYTLLVHTDTMPLFPLLYAKLRFDPVKDFTPVTLFASATIVLAAHPSVPAKDIRELVALARQSPGKVSMTSVGNSSAFDIVRMLLAHGADAKFNVVRYQGSAPAMRDVIAGHVQLGIFNLSQTTQFAAEGRLKLLAVFDPQRNPVVRAVPTIAEAGYSGMDYSARYGISVPAATPRPVLVTLQNAFAQISKDTAYRDEFLKAGLIPLFTTVDETAVILSQQRERVVPALKAANIVPE